MDGNGRGRWYDNSRSVFLSLFLLLGSMKRILCEIRSCCATHSCDVEIIHTVKSPKVL